VAGVARLAELLKKELGVEMELIVGDRSDFFVWVNAKVVLKRGKAHLRLPKTRKCLRPFVRRSKDMEKNNDSK
jgi:hypothetical protein